MARRAIDLLQHGGCRIYEGGPLALLLGQMFVNVRCHKLQRVSQRGGHYTAAHIKLDGVKVELGCWMECAIVVQTGGQVLDVRNYGVECGDDYILLGNARSKMPFEK
jgi:hypothetical protein